MKRLFILFFSSFFIFSLISCGNGFFVRQSDTSASLVIYVPGPSARTAGPTMKTQADVTEYQIILTENTNPANKIVKDAPLGNVLKVSEITPGDYAVQVRACAGNTPIAVANASNVTIRKNQQTDLAMILEMVALVFDNDAENNGLTYDDGVVPYSKVRVLIPGRSVFAAPEGKVIDYWEDDEGNTYQCGEKIPVQDKTLPVHLKAVYGTPLVAYYNDGGTYDIAEATYIQCGDPSAIQVGIPAVGDFGDGYAYPTPVGLEFEYWVDANGQDYNENGNIDLENRELPIKLTGVWEESQNYYNCSYYIRNETDFLQIKEKVNSFNSRSGYLLTDIVIDSLSEPVFAENNSELYYGSFYGSASSSDSFDKAHSITILDARAPLFGFMSVDCAVQNLIIKGNFHDFGVKQTVVNGETTTWKNSVFSYQLAGNVRYMQFDGQTDDTIDCIFGSVNFSSINPMNVSDVSNSGKILYYDRYGVAVTE